jgi:hypothetical protein
MKKRYKNLLVGGCSFSSNGLGGCPPTAESLGGCSYVEDVDQVLSHPGSWAGFLAQRLGIVSLVNVASSSHGNCLTANVILECLNKFHYNSNDTLVVLNITEPTRLDLPCAYDHPDADNQSIPWNQDLISHSYFKKHSEFIKRAEKNIGLEQVAQMTSNSLELLFNFLQNRGLDFYFLNMNRFDDFCLARVLYQFGNHHIKLTPGPSMYEYCQETKTYISESDPHPNKQAHQQIANIIHDRINA